MMKGPESGHIVDAVEIATWQVGKVQRILTEMAARHGLDACWPYPGAPGRYARIRIGKGQTKVMQMHRVVYAIKVGPVPARRVVMHNCDTIRCMNPQHLSCSTMGHNNIDMVLKGRCSFQRPEVQAKAMANRISRYHPRRLDTRRREAGHGCEHAYSAFLSSLQASVSVPMP